MQVLSHPDHLLGLVAPEIRDDVADMLAAIGMGHVPSGVEVETAPPAGSTVIHVGGRAVIVDHGQAWRRRKAIDHLARRLRLARDADTRYLLIALDGRPLSDPPAWSFLAPRVLHDLLRVANWPPERLMRVLDLPRRGARPVRVFLPAAPTPGGAIVPDLVVRAVGNRLHVDAQIAPSLRMQANRIGTCVVERFDVHTAGAALVGRTTVDIADHPALQPGIPDHVQLLPARAHAMHAGDAVVAAGAAARSPGRRLPAQPDCRAFRDRVGLSPVGRAGGARAPA